MAWLSHPAHVADVHETIDALVDLDEGPVVGQVADNAFDLRAGRIAFGHLVPRVGLRLLHAEGKFLPVLVDVEDLHFQGIADRDKLARMIDTPRPAHLTDVDKALDA